MLATFTVNSTSDPSTFSVTDTEVTLREAVFRVNQFPDSDSIDFASNLNGETITLTEGELTINNPAALTIDASGLSNGITVDGNDPDRNDPSPMFGNGIRIFHITVPIGATSPPLVTMKNLTLTGGDIGVVADPGAAGGGAIFSEEARLILENCTIESNSALNGGGVTVWAHNSTGSRLNYLTLLNTRIRNNTTFVSGGLGGFGGGLFVDADSADVSIEQSSSITENHADLDGGGLRLTVQSGSQIESHIGISDSLISGNSSGFVGGGISAENANSLLTIERTTINRNNAVQGGGGVLVNTNDGSLTIANSKITLNKTTAFQVGNTNRNLGAGAFLGASESTVTISGTEISENHAEGFEDNIGGINIAAESNSNILLDHVRITDNRADDDVGGIAVNNVGSQVTIQYSTISGNKANDNNESHYDSTGGAYLTSSGNATTTVKYSTISYNRIYSTSSSNDIGKRAGGIFIRNQTGDTTTILNTTISGNAAEGSGGGIKIGDVSSGAINIRHSTIYNNRADSNGVGGGVGGGIDVGNSESIVTLDHTIVAGNFRGTGSTRDDINSSVTAAWSLIGVNTGTTLAEAPVGSPDANGNLIGGPVHGVIDPHLGDPANNGGPTMTHALLAGSPAIDAGNPLAVRGQNSVPLYDQRGASFSRQVDIPGVHGSTPIIDIGAYEIGVPKIIDVVLRGVQTDNVTPWAREPYSYAELVPKGEQLAPIATYGVNSIQIVFSETVTVPANALTLVRSGNVGGSATAVVVPSNYDAATHTWTFQVLGADRYRIDIQPSLVSGLAGNLDGHWDNQTSTTLYDWTDDPNNRQFVTGSTNGIGGTLFQFKFALNPGDYNRNGEVDQADYSIWRDPGGISDGDGDGLSGTSGDFHLWQSAISVYLWFKKAQGDYNRDGAVNMADYMLWRSQLGVTWDPNNPLATELAGDGDNSGEVNAADYNLYRNWANTIGAWYDPPAGFAGAAALIDSATAPQVMNVIISGSNSVHAAYSFDAHDGSGEQLRTVPVGGADTISIRFSEPVNVQATDLRVVGMATATVPTLADFSYDPATLTAAWRYTGLLAKDYYIMSLSDAATDAEGYRLDGDWVNPQNLTTTNALVSEFPSGNGHAGGNFNFLFTLLAGDASLNASVDFSDLSILIVNYGTTTGGLFTLGDFNGDGAVTSADFSTLLVMYPTAINFGFARADLNFDHAINDLDLTVLANNFGLTGAMYEDGDLNGDGNVTQADLDLMYAQYGLAWDLAT